MEEELGVVGGRKMGKWDGWIRGDEIDSLGGWVGEDVMGKEWMKEEVGLVGRGGCGWMGRLEGYEMNG